MPQSLPEHLRPISFEVSVNSERNANTMRMKINVLLHLDEMALGRTKDEAAGFAKMPDMFRK
jgi:hypothetical protein